MTKLSRGQTSIRSRVLAERTATHRTIGYWHDTVICLSVCLSVTKYIVALRVDVGVESCAVMFLGRPVHTDDYSRRFRQCGQAFSMSVALQVSASRRF